MNKAILPCESYHRVSCDSWLEFQRTFLDLLIKYHWLLIKYHWTEESLTLLLLYEDTGDLSYVRITITADDHEKIKAFLGNCWRELSIAWFPVSDRNIA